MTVLTQLSILQVLCTLLVAASDSLLPGFQECSFQGNSYSIGETFHPRMITASGESHQLICSVCACHATTLVQCETIECPTLNCTAPVRVDGLCCEICLDDSSNASVSLTTAPPDGERSYCFYDGTYYNDGDVFHPDNDNDVFNPTNQSNPLCTTCKCEAGVTVCENISDTCAQLSCAESDQMVRTGECCPICKPFPIQGPGCQDHNGFEYEEGEMFHPYYEVFGGYIDCLNCTCQDSLITCFKEECPPVEPCTDQDEYEAVTLCCPKCSRGDVPPPPVVQPPTATPTPTLQPCESDYYYKLYLCPDGRSMVINNVKNDSAQKFVWQENGAKQFVHMTSKDFQASECSEEQYYKGSTTKQRVNGLTNKEQKKQKIENCTSNCAQMVVKMLRPVATIPIDGC